MIPHELIREAERRYPIGTQFISLAGIKDYVDKHKFKYDPTNKGGTLTLVTQRETQRHIHYADGDQWAKVIGFEEPKVINSYQIF